MLFALRSSAPDPAGVVTVERLALLSRPLSKKMLALTRAQSGRRQLGAGAVLCDRCAHLGKTQHDDVFQ